MQKSASCSDSIQNARDDRSTVAQIDFRSLRRTQEVLLVPKTYVPCRKPLPWWQTAGCSWSPWYRSCRHGTPWWERTDRCWMPFSPNGIAMCHETTEGRHDPGDNPIKARSDDITKVGSRASAFVPHPTASLTKYW